MNETLYDGVALTSILSNVLVLAPADGGGFGIGIEFGE